MKKKEFTEIICKKTKEELIADLAYLFEKFEDVNDYYVLALKKSDKDKILTKFKKKISDALYPDYEFNGGLNLQIVDKILDIFRSSTDDADSIIQLELYALDSGNNCANEFGGDFGEGYYVYFEELFESTIKRTFENKLLKKYEHRMSSILYTAFPGYSHKDSLYDIYYKYFPQTDEQKKKPQKKNKIHQIE
jgi:hypothetical protein